MSNIKFKVPFDKVVIIDPRMTKGKMIPVGTLDEYEKTENMEILNVRLNEDLPEVMRETIEKNPGCLRIMEIPKPAIEVLIIPSRPPIIS